MWEHTEIEHQRIGRVDKLNSGLTVSLTMTFSTTNPNQVRHNSILIKMVKKIKRLFTHFIQWCTHNVWHYLTFFSLSLSFIHINRSNSSVNSIAMPNQSFRSAKYYIDLENMVCVRIVLVSVRRWLWLLSFSFAFILRFTQFYAPLIRFRDIVMEMRSLNTPLCYPSDMRHRLQCTPYTFRKYSQIIRWLHLV